MRMFADARMGYQLGVEDYYQIYVDRELTDVSGIEKKTKKKKTLNSMGPTLILYRRRRKEFGAFGKSIVTESATAPEGR